MERSFESLASFPSRAGPPPLLPAAPFSAPLVPLAVTNGIAHLDINRSRRQRQESFFMPPHYTLAPALLHSSLASNLTTQTKKKVQFTKEKGNTAGGEA